MTDFDIFYQAARAWASGGQPDWLYPFPTLFLFLPFLAFPLPAAKVIWFGLSLAAVVAVFKRFSLLAVFYIPLLQCLFLGQLDPIFLPVVALPSGTGLALLTLKPQLVWLFLPIWVLTSTLPQDQGSAANRKQIVSFLAVSGLLWGLPLLLWPDYLIYWQSRDPAQAAYVSPSLWGGGYLHFGVILIIGGLFIIKAAHTPKEKWAAVTAVNPFLNIYNLVILLPLTRGRTRLALIPLSWVVFWLTNQVGTAWPGLILTLAALFGPYRKFNVNG